MEPFMFQEEGAKTKSYVTKFHNVEFLIKNNLFNDVFPILLVTEMEETGMTFDS